MSRETTIEEAPVDQTPGKICFEVDCGRIPYDRCLQLQHAVADRRRQDRIGDCVLTVEHEPVFTIGRSGSRTNLLADPDELAARGVACVDIERGGDITYHGPGQLVIYPIIKLPARGLGVADFITLLEEAMLAMLSSYNIDGHTDARNRGVWVAGRKIGFVGIAVRRGVSMHGLALNVSPSLDYFGLINPCGLQGVAITSMAEILAEPPSLAEAAEELARALRRSLDTRRIVLDMAQLENLVEAETPWQMQRA